MRHEAMRIFVIQTPSNELQELRDAFIAMDFRNRGSLSLTEIQETANRLGLPKG